MDHPGGTGTPALTPEGAGALGTAVGEAGQGLYRRGVGLVLLAGTLWSLSGFFIRHLEAASDWQIIFYRSTGLALSLLVLLIVRHRARVFRVFYRAGVPAVVAGMSLGAAFMGFIVSITHTTVANTLFLLAATPLFAALVGRAVLGEHVRRATWLAMAAATVGIFVMVVNGLTRGTLLGNLMGLLAAFGSALFAVALRRGRQADMLPAACLAGIFSLAGAATMVGTFALSLHDLAICLALGGCQMSLGLYCFTAGSRHVPAAELTLLSLSEVVLGPFWVWLGFGEVPSLPTLVGGAIMLAAIAGLAMAGSRQAPPLPG